MIQRILAALLLSFFLISFLSCSNQENDAQPAKESIQIDLPSEGIEIADARARPGREGGNSAIYMNILNGSAEADTLLSLSTPVSGMAEVHESYEQEEGMMGMRPVETVVVPGRDLLALEPGGFHVMLMQLNQALTEDDNIELTLEFAKAGEMNLSVLVRSMDR